MASNSKSKPKNDDALRNDLTAVALSTAGALILAALISYSSGSEGLLTTVVAKALFGALGIGAYGVPVLAFVMAVIYGVDRDPVKAPRLVVGAGLLFFTFLIGIHLGVPIDQTFEAGIVDTHGGYIGGACARSLVLILGHSGAWVLLTGLVAIALVLLSRARIADVLGNTATAANKGLRSARSGVKSALKREDVEQSRPRRRKESKPHRRAAVDPSRAPREHTGPGVDLDDELPIPTPSPDPLLEGQSEATMPPPPPPKAPAARTSAANYDGPTKPETDPPVPSIELDMSGPTLADADRFKLPSPQLLTKFPEEIETDEQRHEAVDRLQILEDTLRSFGIDATVTHYERGPVITRYEVALERGVRVNQVTRLADNIAMALAATYVRIEAPIPGKSAIGIEVPNKNQSVVGLRSVVESPEFLNHKSELAIALGRDIAGRPVITDLVDMPHLLVAGSTNSGKSVCLHTIILSFLMRAKPHEVRFIMVDPKRVELSRYDGIPHLMAPVVYSVSAACDVMRKAIREMEKRYDMFAKISAASIKEYNFFVTGARAVAGRKYVTIDYLEKTLKIDRRSAERLMDMLRFGDVVEPPDRIGDEQRRVLIDANDNRCVPMPRVVIVIDELADLMMQARAEFEFSICRIAQLARATGIHLVIATQRPSVKVVTGNIKANIPSRIALAVASQIDSRVILDEPGAEALIGRGDMLFSPLDAPKPRRAQGSFVPREDLERVAEFLRDQGEPSFTIIPQEKSEDDNDGDFASEMDVSDDLYAAAVQYVVQEQQASVSMLQRRFKVGYARAGRLIDAMEQRGVVGPHDGPKPRIVLIAPGMTDDGKSTALKGRIDDYLTEVDDDPLSPEDEIIDPDDENTDATGTSDVEVAGE